MLINAVDNEDSDPDVRLVLEKLVIIEAAKKNLLLSTTINLSTFEYKESVIFCFRRFDLMWCF